MHLNFAGNSFIFGHINRENAPRTFFINLAKQKLPKCVATLTANSSVFGHINNEIAL